MDGQFADAFSGLGDTVFETKVTWTSHDIYPFPLLHFRWSNNSKGYCNNSKKWIGTFHFRLS